MGETKVNQGILQLLNVRNILDNGGFEIWQRGAGPFTGIEHTADRWQLLYVAGGNSNSSNRVVSDLAGGGDYALKHEVISYGGAEERIGIKQVIENAKVYRGKAISFSVWVKTSVGSSGVRIRMHGNGTPSVDTFVYHTGSGNWEKFELTANIPTDTTDLRVEVVLLKPATGIFYMDNAMLVIGSEPVDFVPTLPAEEWDRCLRYLWRTNRFIIRFYAAVALAKIIRWVPYSSIMAATPTWTWTGGTTTNFNNGGMIASISNKIGFSIMLEAINIGTTTLVLDDVNTGYVSAEVT